MHTAYRDLKASRAAVALASELNRIAVCPHAIGDRADLLRRILELSNGRTLEWRRIADIAKES